MNEVKSTSRLKCPLVHEFKDIFFSLVDYRNSRFTDENHLQSIEYILPAFLGKFAVEICSWYHHYDFSIAINLVYIGNALRPLPHPFNEIVLIFKAVIEFDDFIGIFASKT